MFQFRRFPTYTYFIQCTLSEYCSDGFPHSEICGSMLMCSSPQLIAACHVLHRLLMPRHSPCALISLTFVEQPISKLFSSSIKNYAGFSLVHCSFCYPLIYLKKSTKINFVTSLLLARNFLLASLFSFQGTASDLFQGQIETFNLLNTSIRSCLVEVTGLEPVTPCLQSRCSSS